MRVRLALLTLAAAGAAGMPAADAAGGCSYVITGWPLETHTIAVCAQDNPPVEASTAGPGTPVNVGSVCVGSTCTPSQGTTIPDVEVCTSGLDNASVYIDGERYSYVMPRICTP